MIRATTSVDIGTTNVYSRKNWLTMQQIISMRCQCDIISEPEKTDQGYQFVFQPHHPEVYANFTDNLHYLKLDSTGVPMIDTSNDQGNIIVLDAANVHYEYINYK
jgi:hypothetical protein